VNVASSFRPLNSVVEYDPGNVGCADKSWIQIQRIGVELGVLRVLRLAPGGQQQKSEKGKVKFFHSSKRFNRPPASGLFCISPLLMTGLLIRVPLH
jgi:hypothetical protein